MVMLSGSGLMRGECAEACTNKIKFHKIFTKHCDENRDRKKEWF